MITDGKYKIVGDGLSIYKFIVYKYTKVKREFFVEDQATAIEDILRHFLSTVRRTTSPLIR